MLVLVCSTTTCKPYAVPHWSGKPHCREKPGLPVPTATERLGPKRHGLQGHPGGAGEPSGSPAPPGPARSTPFRGFWRPENGAQPRSRCPAAALRPLRDSSHSHRGPILSRPLVPRGSSKNRPPRPSAVRGAPPRGRAPAVRPGLGGWGRGSPGGGGDRFCDSRSRPARRAVPPPGQEGWGRARRAGFAGVAPGPLFGVGGAPWPPWDSSGSGWGSSSQAEQAGER